MLKVESGKWNFGVASLLFLYNVESGIYKDAVGKNIIPEKTDSLIRKSVCFNRNYDKNEKLRNGKNKGDTD